MKFRYITAAFLAASVLLPSVFASCPPPVFAAETVSEVQAAEPLESDTVRFTVVDYDTGEKIDLKKEFGYFAIVPYVWRSDAEQQKPSTNYVYPDSNPYIWKQSISEEEKMSVWLADGSLNDNYFLPEDHEEITRYENGAVDAVIKLKSNESFELPPNTVRVTVTDGDTGELVPDEAFADDSFSFGTCIVTKGGVTGPIIQVRKNRDVIKESLASLYKSAEKFELYFDGKYEIKLYDNNSMDLFLTTVPKDEVNGDVNRDGSFGIADAVTLQQWLLGSANVSMKRWKAADFNTDDKLDVFDLCIMKKKLITSMNESQEDYAFKAEYVRTNGYSPETEFPYTKLISSRDELDTYVEENKDTFDFNAYKAYDSDEMFGFSAVIAKYDEKWFESHKLLMFILEEGSGSNQHKVVNVSKDHADIQRIIPDVGTCDMAEWHILVELDKNAEICSEADYKINFTK